MGVSMKQLWFLSILCLALGAACGSSKTAEQISGYADKVCACPDATCATAVQDEYLAWWKENQRARGSEGDRKDVEKAMERYAQCHLQLVGPEALPAPVAVPKVDLERAPAPPAPVVPEAAEIAPEPSKGDDSKAAKDTPPTP